MGLGAYLVIALLSLGVTLLAGALMNRWLLGVLLIPLLYLIAVVYAFTLDNAPGAWIGFWYRGAVLRMLASSLPSALAGVAVGAKMLHKGVADDEGSLVTRVRLSSAGLGLVAGIAAILLTLLFAGR